VKPVPWTNKRVIAEWGEVPREVLAAIGPYGDFAREHLLNDAMFGMLGDVSGKRVLDAGCGHGYFSRLLAARGAGVVGVEPATSLFDYAVEAERRESHGIRYVKEDLSTLPDLGIFDAVVANMVFIGIPQWRDAMRRCVESLSPGGTFVFSLTHPCFENARSSWLQHGAVLVREYLHEYENVVPYAADFHRPLSQYVNHVISLGCDIVELSEPGLDPAAAVGGPDGVEAYIHVPPFVIVAARRRG
jgi:2-polyprenyl-3-methyl-5-hydroxy-6-metoxy-1,4-benzoquinol methylase